MISSAIWDKSSRVNFSQANQIARAYKASAISSLLHESCSLVIFTVYRTNCCVLLLENFMLFWTSLSILDGRLKAICFTFLVYFWFLAFSLKLGIKTLLLSPHLSALVLLCFPDLPVNQFNFNSLHTISTFYTVFE